MTLPLGYHMYKIYIINYLDFFYKKKLHIEPLFFIIADRNTNLKKDNK